MSQSPVKKKEKSNVIHVDFDSSKTPRQRWADMNSSDRTQYTRGYDNRLVKRLDTGLLEKLH